MLTRMLASPPVTSGLARRPPQVSLQKLKALYEPARVNRMLGDAVLMSHAAEIRLAPRNNSAEDAGVPPQGGPISDSLARRIDRNRGVGEPLDSATSHQMGRSHGFDFTNVRIHTGAEADTLTHALNARAFTFGNDVFFSSGTYQPSGALGRRLLAHELTHVVQQHLLAPSGPVRVGPSDDAHEREAEALGAAVSSAIDPGRTDAGTPASKVSTPLIQRVLPAALVTAGEVLEVALTAAIVVQEQHAITQTGLSYNQVQAARFGDPPQPTPIQYDAEIFTAKVDAYWPYPEVVATFRMHWQGNQYGEIGGAYPQVDIGHTEFQYSRLSVSFMPLSNLRTEGDKRQWPMQWVYEGNFDPAGPGQWEFQGKFEINAFGAFKSIEHRVVSRTTWFGLGADTEPTVVVRAGPNRLGFIPPTAPGSAAAATPPATPVPAPPTAPAQASPTRP